MEHEPIYLDGVDVSECLFYQSNFEEDYDVKIKHFCSNWHNSCESVNNSNCYYKQLARKTQECESLKEEIEILKDNFDTATRDSNELIEELRQECEELKGKYKNVLDLAKQNADANEYCLQELEQENYRYRKALKEIEEIVSSTLGCGEWIGRGITKWLKILNIINKVKGDNR